MDVLIKPLITEKMTDVSEKIPNRFGFIVNKKANKLQIKKAIEELYGVQVNTVNTMVYQGKQRSRMTKSGFISGRTNAYKKAIVTLVEGETIDFYSNI
jgi:large subunit ribosomal protein L23